MFSTNAVLDRLPQLPSPDLKFAAEQISVVMGQKNARALNRQTDECDPLLIAWQLSSLTTEQVEKDLCWAMQFYDVSISTKAIPLTQQWQTKKKLNDMNHLAPRYNHLIVGRTHQDEFRGVCHGVYPNRHFLLWWPHTNWTLGYYHYELSSAQVGHHGLLTLKLANLNGQQPQFHCRHYADLRESPPNLHSVNQVFWLDRTRPEDWRITLSQTIDRLAESVPKYVAQLRGIFFPLNERHVRLLCQTADLYEDETQAVLATWPTIRDTPPGENVVFEATAKIFRLSELHFDANLSDLSPYWTLAHQELPSRLRAEKHDIPLPSAQEPLDIDQARRAVTEVEKTKHLLSGSDAQWHNLYFSAIEMQKHFSQILQGKC